MEEKVYNALLLIREAYDKFGDGLFSGHSGGKDSCVINHLIKTALPNSTNLKVVHNVKPLLGTSNDPVAALTEMHPATMAFLYETVCRNNMVSVMHSSMMPEFIQQNNLTCQIDGARRSEYNRPGKSSNFIRDGESVNRAELPSFVEKGLFDIGFLYPIYGWTDNDVFKYLTYHNLPFSFEYIINGEFDSFLTGDLYAD